MYEMFLRILLGGLQRRVDNFRKLLWRLNGCIAYDFRPNSLGINPLFLGVLHSNGKLVVILGSYLY